MSHKKLLSTHILLEPNCERAKLDSRANLKLNEKMISCWQQLLLIFTNRTELKDKLEKIVCHMAFTAYSKNDCQL